MRRREIRRQGQRLVQFLIAAAQITGGLLVPGGGEPATSDKQQTALDALWGDIVSALGWILVGSGVAWAVITLIAMWRTRPRWIGWAAPSAAMPDEAEALLALADDDAKAMPERVHIVMARLTSTAENASPQLHIKIHIVNASVFTIKPQPILGKTTLVGGLRRATPEYRIDPKFVNPIPRGEQNAYTIIQWLDHDDVQRVHADLNGPQPTFALPELPFVGTLGSKRVEFVLRVHADRDGTWLRRQDQSTQGAQPSPASGAHP